MNSNIIIFDFDGTLADTQPFHMKSWQQIAEDESIILDPTDAECLLGLGRLECVDVVLRRARRTYTEQDRLLLADKKNRLYLEFLSTLPTQKLVFPGVPGLLGELNRRAV